MGPNIALLWEVPKRVFSEIKPRVKPWATKVDETRSKGCQRETFEQKGGVVRNLNLDHKVDIIIKKRLATSLCPPARRFPHTGEPSPAEVCITAVESDDYLPCFAAFFFF